MQTILYNIIAALFLWLGGYAAYMSFNRGLAPNARLQQFLRYLVAACVSIIPSTVTLTTPLQPTFMLILLTAAAWAVAYPLTYHLTFRKNAPGYDNQMDITFGIYIVGMLSGLSLIPYPYLFMGVIIFIALFVPVALIIYYMMYRTVIDDKGMMLIQNTDYNETIEFIRSYPLWRTLSVALLVLLIAVVCIFITSAYPLQHGVTSWWQLVIAAAATFLILIYVWKPKHGVFMRTGVSQLYQLVKEYRERNDHYAEVQQKRFEQMAVRVKRPLFNPHTVLLVIGESASRDYMSVFTQLPEETTPWLKALSEDYDHCVVFPHAYSCDNQTVPTLEKVLTSYNQYDGGDFYSAYSLIDVAKKAGYRVHWFSNQGHLGVADTPITLVANTADVARWTEQDLNHVQYDEELVTFLQDVDPQINNLVVLHLMGSHFNYENRFPPQMRQWGEKGNHDKNINYKNTLFYTDCVLQKAYDYGRKHLNLQTMIYFSDHADVPDRRRQPNFGGYLHLRIPLVIWVGDEFRLKRPDCMEHLQGNSLRYWTNDLMFDLVNGLLDIESDIVKDKNSLTSPDYKYKREDLTAMSGTVKIADDIYEV